jgi:hypothetical protein
LGAGVLPHLGLSSFGGAAASLGHLRLNSTTATQAARYTVDASYGAPASAMATTAWLVYSAADAHGTMLFAEDRKTRRTLPLLAAATSAPITIRGVTDTWVVWSTGAGVSGSAWSVLASRLPGAGGASAPVTLVDSGLAGGDTLVTLGGVWVSGQTALVSGATANGTGLLLRFDLSGATPQATVIARGATPGHVFTDPSSDHGAYYWADVWYDGASGLHGAIWKSNGAGQSSALSGDESSFHPTAAAGTLAWVEVAPDALASMTPGAQSASPDTDEQMLNQLAGALYARNLTSGQQWQVSSRADVTSVRDSGTVVLWRSNSQTHAYDIQSKATSAVQSQVSGATMVTTSDTTMVWTQPGSSSLYVLDTSK